MSTASTEAGRALRVVPLPDRRADADESCRALLRRYAEDQEDGEIAAVGVVVLLRDGSVATDYIATESLFDFVGAVEALAFRVKAERVEINRA